jgi:hypothetical protein
MAMPVFLWMAGAVRIIVGPFREGVLTAPELAAVGPVADACFACHVDLLYSGEGPPEQGVAVAAGQVLDGVGEEQEEGPPP